MVDLPGDGLVDQPGGAGEVVGVGDVGPRVQESGAGEDALFVAREGAENVAGVSRNADAQGDIEGLGEEVDGAVGEAKVEAELGVEGAEPGDDGPDDPHPELEGSGHPEQTPDGTGTKKGGLDGIFGGIAHANGSCEHGLAHLRERHVAGGALEEAHAEVVFEAPEVAADHALGETELTRCVGEGTSGDDGAEDVEAAEALGVDCSIHSDSHSDFRPIVSVERGPYLATTEVVMSNHAMQAMVLLSLSVGCKPTPPATSAAPTHEVAQMSALTQKQQVAALLHAIETGAHEPIGFINPNQYTQHNLAVADGLAGFGAVMAQLPEGSAKARVVRVFQDGDFVFAHTEYNFFGPKVGFDVFRFEEGRIVEHWDNLQETAGPNPSGHTMTDGPTEATDLDRTQANKELVRGFVQDVLKDGRSETITQYISTETYVQHNPAVADGLDGLGAALAAMAEQGVEMVYTENHAVFGEGDFVLSISEGRFAGAHVAFYDLFRVADGRIVEHWDTIEAIPPRSEWKNDNGKFGF